ncbi:MULTISPECIES: transcriptional repressor TraM [Rhizobium/Agrobacterium group]|uniref:Transcriptional repressor n=2 Tax=Rhizobium/Agrobacterium group TaxID=227290 RepID=B9K3W1_ALLAM|nr:MULTISPECIES: transcriptional repressor TraM [Rhizobium/Agrobacterium group]ACM39616.1 transcriptional repressor [Allorhizobium ampelinum S4]ASK49651.1 plasmid partitioning protein [Agrobacterium vitis]MCF1437064.1 transcriptional regulator [Allorhizobium ampelinum]MCF1450734.1 transcriptional regulator [Allorhizobium ampelinum]MCF1496375.1 transcriptional regulator [Allorhizobium ampelinum]
MELEDAAVTKKVELRPLIGLTHGLPPADLETITIDAIRTHRQLVEKADELFQALPETYKTGEEAGGPQHVRYIEASIEMHAQMSAVNTLISILGFIPKVVVN